MGEVWRGVDTLLERTVAVKVLHAGLAADPTFRQRFYAEARAVAALQSPGVVSLFDYGEDDSHGSAAASYLVMEHVHGSSVRDALTEHGTLDPDRVLDVVAQAAQALHTAHDAQIIHRDVKPGNILIDGTRDVVKVVDFGVARAHGASALTDPGVIMGSVAYVAPELLRGEDPGPASDIYALGVVAYECLSGRKPFDADGPTAVVDAHLHQDPPPLPEHVPAAVTGIVMRALEKDPRRRWASAADLATACRDVRSTDPIDIAETQATSTQPQQDDVTVALSARSQTPEATAPAPQRRRDVGSHRRRTRRSRMLTVSAVVAALLTAGAVAAAAGWHEDDPGPTESEQRTGATAADIVAGEDMLTPPAPDEGEASDQSPDQHPESSDAQSPSDDPSDSPSDDPTSSEPTASVPALLGMSESEAESTLQDAGFTAADPYDVGDGDHACAVVEQDPGSGVDHPVDEPVAFGIQHVDDPQDCDDDVTIPESPSPS